MDVYILDRQRWRYAGYRIIVPEKISDGRYRRNYRPSLFK